jgi:hypothetical protein
MNPHSGVRPTSMLRAKLYLFVSLSTQISLLSAFLRITWLALLSVLASAPGRADNGLFKPAKTLDSWYTSREPIDLELIASTGVGKDARPLEPKRVLRLRLERAYVAFLIQAADSPTSGFGLSLDTQTGRAGNLLTAAPTDQARSSDKSAPRRPTRKDVLERNLSIRFSSDNLSEHLLTRSANLEPCRGEQLGDGLFAYKKSDRDVCAALSLGNRTRYFVRYSEDLLLLVSCQTGYAQQCELSIPYQGFSPIISFGAMRLHDWREVMAKAILFLDAKKYQQ